VADASYLPLRVLIPSGCSKTKRPGNRPFCFCGSRQHTGARVKTYTFDPYNLCVKQLVLEIVPPPQPSFANFVAGRDGEALAALLYAASGVSPQPAKVIYLWGSSGAGKTHLIEAMRGSDANVLLQDNVQRLDDAAQVGLFNAINERALLSDSAVVVAGDTAPRALPLRPELSSRLGSGLVFQIQSLTDDEKAAALRSHAASRAFRLHEDVVAYLLRHSRRDMPSLIATLDALDRYSLETGREITLPLLKQMPQPNLI